jgi:ribonuclease-3
MKDFSKIEKIIGVNFKNKDYLTQAFVHRSYINENPNFNLPHNERLEYLGDAVLELIVSEYLYKNYPNPEGDLTNWRASLVNAKMLAEIAQKLEFDHYLFLSRGEAKDKNSKARNSILANTFEAVIGALYLDHGFTKTKNFVKKVLLAKLPEIIKNHLYLDPKSKLQEIAQDKLNATPSYKVLDEWGPDHNRHFKIGVYFNKELVASGEGSSKQEAQVEAAKQALIIKNW